MQKVSELYNQPPPQVVPLSRDARQLHAQILAAAFYGRAARYAGDVMKLSGPGSVGFERAREL